MIDAAPFDAAAATPVLLDWLPRVTSARLKEAIIRHLRNKAAKGIATAAVMHEFQNTDNETVRWVAGDALQYLATPPQRPLLVALAADRTYGRGRQMLFEALGRLKTAASEQAVRAALTDGDVALHAGSAFRQLVDDEEAAAVLGELAEGHDAIVARAAQRNLERLARKRRQ